MPVIKHKFLSSPHDRPMITESKPHARASSFQKLRGQGLQLGVRLEFGQGRTHALTELLTATPPESAHDGHSYAMLPVPTQRHTPTPEKSNVVDHAPVRLLLTTA